MKAGFAKTDITPRVGVELYGFGPYLNRKSIGVRDRLESRAGAFEVNGKKVLIISNDLCTLQVSTVADIRFLIREKYPELGESDIMVNTSHTHSGPATLPPGKNTGWGVTDPPYLAILPYRIAEAGCKALENLEEAIVSAASVPCRHIGLNRVLDKDAPPLEEVLNEDWEPAKPELTDTRCIVIRFDSLNKELKGFIAYFGCHPVVCSASNHFIHGDYPAVAMHSLMREFPGSVGMFLQGAEGDVNSGCVHKAEQDSLLALDVFAARFANAVREGLQCAETLDIREIKTISRKFCFSTRQVFTPEKIAAIKKQQEEKLYLPDAQDDSGEVRMAAVYLRGIQEIEAICSRSESVSIEAELQVIRIGPLEFMGTPFEVMQSIKNEIHAASKAEYPMLMSLTNGSLGYAPDQRSLEKNFHDKTGGDGNYESTMVPLIAGRLPYGNIHRELVCNFDELNRALNRDIR